MKKIILSTMIASVASIISYSQNMGLNNINVNNISATGTISATGLTISGGNSQLDSLRILKKLKVGSGTLYLDNTATNPQNTNAIYTDNVLPPSGLTDLFIQSNSSFNNNTIINANNFGHVHIGDPPTTNGQPDNITKLEIRGSVSIYDGAGTNNNGNGDNSLYFGREQTTLQLPASRLGEWGIQYWFGGPTANGGNNTGVGGLNFWKPSGSDGGFANGLLWLGDNGKVGVNTYNPTARFEIVGGTTSATSSLQVKNFFGSTMLFVRDDEKVGIRTSNPQSVLEVKGLGTTSSTSAFHLTDNAGASLLLVKDNGQIKIGTMEQVTGNHTDYKLAVDGKVVSREVVVIVQNWADNEFKSLATFDEIEKEKLFVNNNSHLKGIPSEKEILENGIEAGNMFVSQMKKTEQLFKYSFLFSEEITNLKKENSDLKAELDSIKKELDELKKK